MKVFETGNKGRVKLHLNIYELLTSCRNDWQPQKKIGSKAAKRIWRMVLAVLLPA
jgi:hypothetical protein